MLLTFDYEARQSTCHIGTGIDVDPVRQDFGSPGWGVAVDDALPKIHSASKKFAANPQQVLGALPLKGDAGPNTGVA